MMQHNMYDTFAGVGEHVCRPSLLCNPVHDKIDNNNNNNNIPKPSSANILWLSYVYIYITLYQSFVR